MAIPIQLRFHRNESLSVCGSDASGLRLTSTKRPFERHHCVDFSVVILSLWGGFNPEVSAMFCSSGWNQTTYSSFWLHILFYGCRKSQLSNIRNRFQSEKRSQHLYDHLRIMQKTQSASRLQSMHTLCTMQKNTFMTINCHYPPLIHPEPTSFLKTWRLQRLLERDDLQVSREDESPTFPAELQGGTFVEY